MAQTRSASIDALRFAAAMAVLAVHWLTGTYVFNSEPVIWFGTLVGVAQYGYLGVDLFFIISGAVISRSAINREPGAFLKSRFARLAPAFLLCSLGSAAVASYYWNSICKASPLDWLPNITFIRHFVGAKSIDDAYWTLEREWIFYLLIAGLAMIFRSRGLLTKMQPRSFAFVWLVVATGLQTTQGLFLVDYLLMPKLASLFIAGILIGTSETRKERLVALIPLLITFQLAVGFRLYNTTTFVPKVLLLVIAFMIIFGASLLFFWNANIYAWQNKFVTYLGKLSYPIYLTHYTMGLALINGLFNAGLNPYAALFIALIAVLLASHFIVTKWEPYAQSWLRRVLRSEQVDVSTGSAEQQRLRS